MDQDVGLVHLYCMACGTISILEAGSFDCLRYKLIQDHCCP